MAPANWGWDQYYQHYVCYDCNWSFRDRGELDDHLEDDHFCCLGCDQKYSSQAARRSHWANSRVHSFCTSCDTFHANDDQLRQHKHVEHYRCINCGTFFASELGRHEHARQAHTRLYCVTHRQGFATPANYNAHMRSAEHVGRNQPCPFSCGRMFPDRSTVALHLDGGACKSGITRAMIDNFMRTHDQQRLITSPQPMMIDGPPPVATMYATERSWNAGRQAYVCVLCNNSFKALHSLNAHLASPRHAYTDVDDATREKQYRCPNKACGRPFRTLSGVIQHAEYGGCGVLQVRGMNRALDQVLGQTKAITWN
ncbi:hypothetical protein JCM10908_002778 [Rhodotorula pacifica]|uniref:uncharacterized protein n=1 Tax=Rhodotorula pacifica TaxID=1495444 RepID=UPI00317FF80A